MNRPVKFLVSILGCFAVAYAGSVVTMPAIGSWYATLNKPSFNPPNWIFGLVWSGLYLMMGVSGYLVWVSAKKSAHYRLGLLLFVVQLTLNFLWSLLFFYFQSPVLALVDIGLLWTAILFTIINFRQVSPTAAWLLVPYLLWVSFATVLNLAIVMLN